MKIKMYKKYKTKNNTNNLVNSHARKPRINKKKIMKGGGYNTKEIDCLKEILFTYGFDEINILLIMNTFNITAQMFPFYQLIPQIVNERFIEDFAKVSRAEINITGILPEEITEGRNDVIRVLLFYRTIILEQQEGDTDNESSEGEGESESDNDNGL